MGRFTYEPSQGAAQHRRTLYAFWRRSIAPTFLFDSAQRRVCEVAMTRTNTPLQALTLLNDETMMEASRAPAKRMLGSPSSNRLQLLYRSVLSREATPKAVSYTHLDVYKRQVPIPSRTITAASQPSIFPASPS